jgi:hypothetical protein
VAVIAGVAGSIGGETAAAAVAGSGIAAAVGVGASGIFYGSVCYLGSESQIAFSL